MRLGLNLGLGSMRGGGGTPPFSPASLFASGEEGVWYEPSTTSAFLSTTDLTPCAVGDACGFLLDKSQGAGYSGGSFTGLGSELVTNGDFSDGLTNVTAFEASVSVTDGNLSIESIGSRSDADRAEMSVSGLTVGAAYLFEIRMRNSVGNSGGIEYFTFTDDTPRIEAGSDFEIYQFVATATDTSGLIRLYAVLVASGGVNGNTLEVDYVSLRKLPGNHATQTTAAARPILRQTGGGLYYLEFDGVDDGMLTPIIDFTATDKMSVFTAASVASDTSPMFIAELSRSITNADGSFGLVAGTPDADVWRFISKGTAISVANAGNGDLDAPYVVSALSDISGNSVVVRKNAVSGVETTDDQGTGNYTNDSISICSRDMQLTPQYFLDGNLYGLIVRGAASTTEEISNTETYLAAKSGVTL